MSNSIRLSKKYGVNPSMPVCFFCGKVKNEIILAGKINKEDENGKVIERDVEAPKYAVYDYEPCDECKEKMKKGVTLVGVVTEPMQHGQMPIQRQGDISLYPTGRWACIKEDAFKRIFGEAFKDPDLFENILKQKRCIMDDSLLKNVLSGEENE